MQKINFENYPSTNTPINADNLNQLQTNIEDAINKIEVIKTNVTIEAGGTSGTATVELPEGYTRQNSAVIFKNYETGSGNKTDSSSLSVSISYNQSQSKNLLYIVLGLANSGSTAMTVPVNVGLIQVDYSEENNNE